MAAGPSYSAEKKGLENTRAKQTKWNMHKAISPIGPSQIWNKDEARVSKLTDGERKREKRERKKEMECCIEIYNLFPS